MARMRSVAALAATLGLLLGGAGARAQSDLGAAWEAYDAGHYKSAYELFAPLAEAGDPDAQYGLGVLLSDGLGVTADRAAAVTWFERSANQGHDAAMVNLGYYLDLGLGVASDRDLAEYWYSEAADMGNLMAMNNLAYMWAEDGRQLDQALEMIQGVVNAIPDEPSYLDTLGWALYQMGRFAEAVVPICDAVTLEPGHPELRLHLGDAYWRLGRAADANNQWRRGARLFDEPGALSDNGADFIDGRGRQLLGALQNRLKNGLPAGGPAAADASGVDAPLPALSDECTVPLV